MKESIRYKLTELSERYEELGVLLSQAAVIAKQDDFRRYSQEYSDLEDVVRTFAAYQAGEGDVAEALALTDDADPEMREMGKEELKLAQAQVLLLEESLKILKATLKMLLVIAALQVLLMFSRLELMLAQQTGQVLY